MPKRRRLRSQTLARVNSLAHEDAVRWVESTSKAADVLLHTLHFPSSLSCAGHFSCKSSSTKLVYNIIFSFNMRSLAIISLAALAVASPLNPQVEEGDKALAALKDVSPDDANAVQMVSEDQRQDQGVGEILSALGQNSPDVRSFKTTCRRLFPRSKQTYTNV